MGNRGLDRFAIEMVTIGAPGVVGSGLGGFGELIEFVIEGFGRDNFRLFVLFVIDAEVHGYALVEDRNLASGLLANSDLGFAQGVGGPLGKDLVDDLLVLHGEVLGENAGILKREELIELGLRQEQWAVGVMAASGLDGKTAVEILDKLVGKSIGVCDGGDILQTQFFDQAILQGGDDPLDAPFGLRGVSADDLDLQSLHSPAELGHTGAGERIGDIDLENAVFITVESQRAAMAGQILAGGLEVAESILRRCEIQRLQLAAGIVNVDQQSAGWRAAFKPGMRGAIDLHQFTNTSAALAHRVDGEGLRLSGFP